MSACSFRADIFPPSCGEGRGGSALWEKSRCLTHMAAVCVQHAGFFPSTLPLSILTFAPARLLQPPSLTLSPPHFFAGCSHHAVAVSFFFLLCCMPASLYLPPYLPVSVLFFSISVSTRFPSLSTSLSHLFSPPPCAPATLHPASLHPALLPFLSLSLLPARAHMTHTG